MKFQHLHADWAVIGHAAALLSTAGWLLLMPALAAGLWRVRQRLARERQQLQGELARIFEQLDLLRLDAQEGAIPVASPPEVPVLPAVQCDSRAQGLGGEYGQHASDYHTAARLAARGSSAAEIAERCGLVGGEARVLVALQQARARRAEAA